VSVDRREGGVALRDDGVLRVGLDEWVEVREDVGVELDLCEGVLALANLASQICPVNLSSQTPPRKPLIANLSSTL
jgi:hypothetical protein